MTRHTHDQAHEDDVEATLAAMPVEHAHAPEHSPSDLYKLPPNHVIWGQTVPVPAQVTTKNPLPPSVPQTVLLKTETYREAVDFHITIAPQSLPGSGTIYITVAESLGQVQFSRVYEITTYQGLKARTIHVNSRFVQVTAAWTGAASAGTVNFNIGCGVGGIVDAPLSGAVQQWFLGSGANAGETVTPYTMPGGMALSAYQAMVTTMSGDSQMYVLFFDAATSLVSGVTAPLWRTPAFTVVNAWLAFDDEEDPQVTFNTGIQWAASSTPAVYTTPTGSPILIVDCKVAQ